MSTVEADLAVESQGVKTPSDLDLTQAREARVGEMTVRRLLPLRRR
jgi:hypothetical protein